MTQRFHLSSLRQPLVQAPLAGGPSTVELAAAVTGAGALGFLAAGYRPAAAVGDDIRRLRGLVRGPFGVNLFVPGGARPDDAALDRYVERIRPEAERHGVELGAPRADDDGWEEKLEVLTTDPVAVVSLTFGCPDAAVVRRLQDAGSAVWVTVTGVEEARLATGAGADALVVQGTEAGGHRASFDDDPEDLGLLPLLQLVGAAVPLPLVASGGIATGAAVAAALCAGAAAVQVGTAFMRTPEAGTSGVHRRALGEHRRTRTTRAFTGRLARTVANRFAAEHSDGAPSAYPQVHHVTAPLRAAGRASGDGDVVNLWAGQAHELATERPAAEVVETLMAEARTALAAAAARLDPPRI